MGFFDKTASPFSVKVGKIDQYVKGQLHYVRPQQVREEDAKMVTSRGDKWAVTHDDVPGTPLT